MSASAPSDGGFVLDFATLEHAPVGATPLPGGGAVFRVWSPTRTVAHVRGEFNGWGTSDPMTKLGEHFVGPRPRGDRRPDVQVLLPEHPLEHRPAGARPERRQQLQRLSCATPSPTTGRSTTSTCPTSRRWSSTSSTSARSPGGTIPTAPRRSPRATSTWPPARRTSPNWASTRSCSTRSPSSRATTPPATTPSRRGRRSGSTARPTTSRT